MSVHEDALRDLAANHGWGFCDAVADEINDLEASYASLFKTHGELQSDLASAQEELERERMRLVACGVVAMANTPESAADARQIHEDYRSASLSDVERAVNAEMKLRTDLAAAQEALKFVERWANHHGVKPTCTAEAALSIIQHYPPILAITRSYADGKVPETRNPWAELKEAQEARERAEERAAACELVAKGKLWLWKNFVDGRPEYWAFDNPFPINLDNGDPQTLGDPCGYALFKPSRVGRTDVSDEEVLRRIDSAIAARAK